LSIFSSTTGKARHIFVFIMPPLSEIESSLPFIMYDSDVHSSESLVSTALTKSLAPKPRRTVSFGTTLQMKQTIHIRDYTADEIENTWYSTAEYKLIKLSVSTIVLMLKQGEQLRPDQCVRGLEYKTRHGRETRVLNQIEALIAVLDEQDRQALNDEKDLDRLSQVYTLLTAHCVATAHYIGLNDHRAAIESASDVFAPSQQLPQRRLSCTAA
jgi:hypothetical protein